MACRDIRRECYDLMCAEVRVLRDTVTALRARVPGMTGADALLELGAAESAARVLDVIRRRKEACAAACPLRGVENNG